MAFLELSALQKHFGANHVVRSFNLDVEKGEFVTLLGPSGCGKTTVLRMVAGFETPSAGAIRIDGRDVTALRTSQRDIGMVFQAYALFPNMTVAENVAFGLKVAGRPRAEIDERVREMLGIIHLPDLGARYPFQLSGGQQQRVALARALAAQPKVLLLDEPLSALDAKIRVSLRTEIRAIQRKLGITTIFVTHDQEEALSISDRIVVMNGGVAEQVGPPFDIYNRPATRFVAGFVGTLNLLEARVIDASAGRLALGDQEIALGRVVPAAAGETVSLALRPEAIALAGGPGEARLAGQSGDARLAGQVTEVSFLGSVVRVRADIAGGSLALDTFNNAAARPPAPGERVEIAFAPGDVLILPD